MKLVYFWADWNGRSKSQKSGIENYCKDNNLELVCYNDDNEAMMDYDVEHLPTLLVLDDYDVPIGRFVGRINLDKIDKLTKRS